MLVGDINLYPKKYTSTNSTSADGIIVERFFYNTTRAKQTPTNWAFKWIYTPVDDTEEFDIEIVVNN